MATYVWSKSFFVLNNVKTLKVKWSRNGKFYSLFRWEKNVVL